MKFKRRKLPNHQQQIGSARQDVEGFFLILKLAYQRTQVRNSTGFEGPWRQLSSWIQRKKKNKIRPVIYEQWCFTSYLQKKTHQKGKLPCVSNQPQYQNYCFKHYMRTWHHPISRFEDRRPVPRQVVQEPLFSLAFN